MIITNINKELIFYEMVFFIALYANKAVLMAAGRVKIQVLLRLDFLAIEIPVYQRHWMISRNPYIGCLKKNMTKARWNKPSWVLSAASINQVRRLEMRNGTFTINCRAEPTILGRAFAKKFWK